MQKCDPVRRHIKIQINIHIQTLTYTMYKGQQIIIHENYEDQMT